MILFVFLITRLRWACFFFYSLDKINPAHGFTLDKETDYTLPFLDVLVHRTLSDVTLIYHKPTFMGLYTW